MKTICKSRNQILLLFSPEDSTTQRHTFARYAKLVIPAPVPAGKGELRQKNLPEALEMFAPASVRPNPK